MFALGAFDKNAYLGDSVLPENEPVSALVFEDPGNTATGGNTQGPPGIYDDSFPTRQLVVTPMVLPSRWMENTFKRHEYRP